LSELVVARGDAPLSFDFVASSVKALGIIDFLDGITVARNNRLGAFIFDLLPHFVAVVGLVECCGQWRSGRAENFTDDLTVVDLSARRG
jgi:hypothetical protein